MVPNAVRGSNQTAAWGGVDQGPFLNAVLIAYIARFWAACGDGWLHRGRWNGTPAGSVDSVG